MKNVSSALLGSLSAGVCELNQQRGRLTGGKGKEFLLTFTWVGVHRKVKLIKMVKNWGPMYHLKKGKGIGASKKHQLGT